MIEKQNYLEIYPMSTKYIGFEASFMTPIWSSAFSSPCGTQTPLYQHHFPAPYHPTLSPAIRDTPIPGDYQIALELLLTGSEPEPLPYFFSNDHPNHFPIRYRMVRIRCLQEFPLSLTKLPLWIPAKFDLESLAKIRMSSILSSSIRLTSTIWHASCIMSVYQRCRVISLTKNVEERRKCFRLGS